MWKTHFTQKNGKAFLYKHFWHNWLANLQGFANICKLPVSISFKDMHSKIVIESSFIQVLKILLLYVLQKHFLCAICCANFSCFKNCGKSKKSLKTVKF